MRHPNIVAAAILGTAVLGSTAIWVWNISRYSMSGRSNSSSVFVLDRYSGVVRHCDYAECEVLRDKPARE
jgi:hypothetical protein